MKLIKSILIVALIAVSSVTFAQQKFGVVAAQEILMKMPEIDSVKIKLDKITQNLSEEMASTEKEYTTKVQDFQKNLSTYSATMREQKEKDLQSLLTRMQEFEQVAQREIQEQQAQLMAPIQKRLLDAISKVGADGGYCFIFDKQSALYTSATLVVDVTELVRAALKMK